MPANFSPFLSVLGAFKTCELSHQILPPPTLTTYTQPTQGVGHFLRTGVLAVTTAEHSREEIGRE
jgi:hypothetical protein